MTRARLPGLRVALAAAVLLPACDAPVELAARPLSPLSTSTSSTQMPTFRWELAPGYDGAHVELCRDRALTESCASFDAAGSSGAPAVPLAGGLWFWRVRARSADGTETIAGPIWELAVRARSGAVATSTGTFPDVNGDGHGDVIAGGYVGLRSVAFVLHGSAGGLFGSPAVLAGSRDESFAIALGSAGDVNGDGYSDVWVRSNHSLHVYPGGASGLDVEPQIFRDGSEVASAGDVDGDGFADLIASTCQGLVLYRGGAAGLAAPIPVASIEPSCAEHLAGGADFDGDGFADSVSIESTVAGTVWTLRELRGGPDGLTNARSVALDASFAARAVGFGDVNGDGYSDVIVEQFVGIPTVTAAALVFLGSSTGLAAAPIEIGDEITYGSDVATGDVDGDGYDDVVVSAATELHVYRGGPTGPSLAAVVAALISARAVVGARDVDRDGYADVVLGAGGQLYVYRGSASGLGAEPMIVVPERADALSDVLAKRAARTAEPPA